MYFHLELCTFMYILYFHVDFILNWKEAMKIEKM